MTEVVVSLGLIGLTASGIIAGYIQSARFADWQAHALAAHTLALQRVEQCRAAKWDTRSFPQVDRLTSANFPDVSEQLDIPMSGTNAEYATVYTTITSVTVDPPLRMIQADCVWQYRQKLFTNTVVTYRAPDQ